ncbi:MAG: septation protein IspZ [Myxococcales bacterium]
MNLTKLFVTQLLPLLVFIVVDSFVTDVRISIACAVVFAFGQLVVTWARTKRIDWFILLDVALIAGLGGISIAFEDDLFFKVKPAIVEAVTIVFMLVLVVAPSRFLIGYFGRMVPNLAVDPQALGSMKAMLGLMCGYTALHIAAVLYAAFRMSRESWAFISGPGFYVFFVPVLAVVFVRALRERRKPRVAAPPATPNP